MASYYSPQTGIPEYILLDPAVRELLPENYQYRAITFHKELWYQLVRIEALVDEEYVPKFFLKLATERSGYNILMADYESAVMLGQIIPSNCLHVLASGRLSSEELDEETHFLLLEYKELTERPEDVFPIRLGQTIARLHTNSRAHDLYPPKHPELGGNKFGFHRQTNCHTIRQHLEWSSAWHEFFAKHTGKLLELERDMWDEPNVELEWLCVGLVERVIPRLLRPLETDGRTIDPVLVHGNLDHGGFSTEVAWGEEGEAPKPNHGEAILFNGGVLWAHNEYDLGPLFAMRTHHQTEEHQTFVDRVFAVYHSIIPKAEPVEEWEARLRLYSLRTFIYSSALQPQNQRMRDFLINQIRILVDEFGGGGSDGSPMPAQLPSSSEISE